MYGTRLQIEVVPRPEGAKDQIYRIYTVDMRLCPTLQDEITNSEKTYIANSYLVDQLVKL